MNKSGREDRVKDIRNFIMVLLGAVVSAFLIAGVLVYRYSPSGVYKLDNVVIDPEVVEKLTNDSRFTLKEIGYRYFEGKGTGYVYTQVSNDTYSKFFGMIRNEQSLNDVKKEYIAQFFTGKPASIILKIASSNEKDKTIVQEIQILPNGVFRVKLLQNSDRDQWAYFYQDRIYQNAQTLFLPK